MTTKLKIYEGELRVLPLNGLAPSNKDIAAHLREQADWLEASDANEVRNCILIMEYSDGGLFQVSCGQPMDLARAVGLMQMTIVRKTMGALE